MQNYISQLLNDLAAAKNNPRPGTVDYALLYPDHPAYAYGLDYIVAWEMAPQYKMDDLFGIKAEQLPPADKLTDEQAAQLIKAILELWVVFNLVVDSDRDAPPLVFYNVLVDYWATTRVEYDTEKKYEIDLCSYNTDLCIWGSAYCTCEDFEEDEDLTNAADSALSELQKGIVQNDKGGMSWVNPKLLNKNGNFKPY
jgi:hypothetical protein